ncbi:MAG: hypothetical protein QXS78_02100 [Candidatus Micrarchaeaceae archaeon]
MGNPISQGRPNGNGTHPYRILVLSDLFPGTKAFSKDNFIGLAEYFNDPNVQKPNMVVYFGGKSGLIPWIPSYEHESQLLMIEDGINFMSDVPAIIKPHVERLNNALGDPKVYFALGTADSQNIGEIARNLRYAYGHNPQWLLEALRMVYTNKRATSAIIKSTENSIEALEKQLDKNPKDAQLKAEYQNAKKKLKLNRDEYKELEERAETLKILVVAARIARLSKEKLQMTMDNLEKQLEEKNKEFKALKNENGTAAAYKKTANEAKAISKLLRAARKRLEEIGNLELESMAQRGSARIEAFTHNVRIKPDIEKIINKLAKMEYYSYINDIDRKHRVAILDKDLTFISKKLNNFEFTIALKAEPILGTSSKMYNKNSNTLAADNFYRYVETIGKREVLQKPLTMLISGGNVFTSFSVEPTLDLDREKIFVSLAKGTFADREALGELYNQKIITRTTKTVEKLPPDSSASIVDIFPDGYVAHTSITSEFLKIKRIEADKRELAVATELIKLKKANKTAQSSHTADTEAEEIVKDPKLEKLILEQKRPSELKSYEIPKLSTKQILELIPYAAKEIPNNIKKLAVVAMSDIHEGGWAENDLLEKAVQKGKEYIHNLDSSRIPILLLNGDIIEGNLANFKNSPQQLTLPNTFYEYRNYLQKLGLSGDQINAELVKFFNRVSIIQTISAQAESVIQKLLPVIDETINKNGYIWIVSGNHFNKTNKTHEYDEATELAGIIKLYLKGKGVSEGRVIVVTGEDYGIGNINIDNEDTIRVQHKLARALEQKPQAILQKRVPVAAVFEAHYHEPKHTISGDLQTFETPAMQYEDENTYVSEFPQAISDATRGFIIAELDLKDNKTIKSVLYPILRANLERSGELEKSLYHAFMRDKFAINTHNKNTVSNIKV